ncbi:MAG TPA: hypothetical protein VEZ12_04045, partial [Herpetosiphonaceae bacterium]|nr:hypothetical protein [Herpetosiphonaceae bacterium]
MRLKGNMATTTQERNNPSFPQVDLRATIRPSALMDLSRGEVKISGRVPESQAEVVVRVTTGQGRTHAARFPVREGSFRCRYPADFPGAPTLSPGVLFLDAAIGSRFEASGKPEQQAEVTVLVYDSRRRLVPDYPSAFTANLLDRRGRRDAASREWPAMRALVNLYLRSRGAHLAGAGRPDFDLARPADLAFFKDNLALYDFDHRDR